MGVGWGGETLLPLRKQLKDSHKTHDPPETGEKVNRIEENAFALLSSKDTRPLNESGKRTHTQLCA